MSASVSVMKITTLQDRLAQIINTHSVQGDEIDSVIQEEFINASSNRAINTLTDLGHLVSFIKFRKFANPLLALQTYIDEGTSLSSRKALVKAILMTSEKDDKSYELICYLARQNKLERFTEISQVPPLHIYHNDGGFEEYTEWYLLFELFGLSRIASQELIRQIADWIINKAPSLQELNALRTFIEAMNGSAVLVPEFFGRITTHFHNKTIINQFELVFSKLQTINLLKPDVLELIIPLLIHVDAISSFLTIYQMELQQKNTRAPVLEQLPSYCLMTMPSEGCYDDKVPTNTPLHQSIIERNLEHIAKVLAYANSNLLNSISYENTALLLACKLADKKAAKLILAKMTELGCAVNHQDTHGMTALHWANFYHFDDLIADLKAAGANEHIKASNGKTSSFFYHHKFTIGDFKKQQGEIIEGAFQLNNAALTDLSFHMDKIALNLKLTTTEIVMDLYRSDPIAQMRTANRFQLFLLSFRDKLVNWLNMQQEADNELSASHHHGFNKIR